MKKKYCKHCDSDFDKTEEHWYLKNTKGTIYYVCRKKRDRDRKQYYQDNREEAIACAQRHHLADPVRRKELKAKWDAENKDIKAIHDKRYYDKNKEKIRNYHAEWSKANQHLLKGSQLRKYWPELNSLQAYERYEKMIIDQEFCCKICKRHQSELTRTLCVDHNHKTGKVRGLLCSKCNGVLVAIVENSSDLLEIAREYLKENLKED